MVFRGAVPAAIASAGHPYGIRSACRGRSNIASWSRSCRGCRPVGSGCAVRPARRRESGSIACCGPAVSRSKTLGKPCDGAGGARWGRRAPGPASTMTWKVWPRGAVAAGQGCWSRSRYGTTCPCRCLRRGHPPRWFR